MTESLIIPSMHFCISACDVTFNGGRDSTDDCERPAACQKNSRHLIVFCSRLGVQSAQDDDEDVKMDPNFNDGAADEPADAELFDAIAGDGALFDEGVPFRLLCAAHRALY